MSPLEWNVAFESVWNTGLYFLPFLIFIVNGFTSIHIILNKQNIRAAVGWLGLVWLSPGPGAVLYAVFGINRIRRRARRLFEKRDEYHRGQACFTVSEQSFEQYLAEQGKSHLKSLNR